MRFNEIEKANLFLFWFVFAFAYYMQCRRHRSGAAHKSNKTRRREGDIYM